MKGFMLLFISLLLICGGLGLRTKIASLVKLDMKIQTHEQPIPVSMPLSKSLWKSSAAVFGIISASAFINIPRATAESNPIFS